MSKGTRRKYTREFKVEALRLVEESGKPLTQVARELGIELLPHACRRMRDTPSQSALPWKERKKNMRDAFCCDADLAGKRVALLDDVLTTGASLNALAEAVQKRGAVEISAWVVARTLPHRRT